ncbi:MAG: class I SAM-dependent methyltransferase [Coriobacteriales bacterium]|jgi:SAM-dependent methyltransferase|nr:class I SAM-dependent methyltransferase [Coriobacteriales bacterium]
MDKTTLTRLIQLNNKFYREYATSFSATRQRPWSGWQTSLNILQETDLFNQHSISVFDLACGNLRFESFLQAALPATDITFFAVDNSIELAQPMAGVHYQNLDVLDALLCGSDLGELLQAPLCDLSVSFGFMHHVPTFEYRLEILRSLITQTRSGGYVIVSFWQFMKDQTIAIRTLANHHQYLRLLRLENQDMDENDFILGWMGILGAYRYCHSFTDDEIDQLIDTVATEVNISVVSRFTADGRSNYQNCYFVIKVT